MQKLDELKNRVEILNGIDDLPTKERFVKYFVSVFRSSKVKLSKYLEIADAYKISRQDALKLVNQNQDIKNIVI